MPLFRKRPVTVEAVQFTGDNASTITEVLGLDCIASDGDTITVITLEGNMRATIGDWIIKGVAGEAYPCRDSIFERTYELVTEEG